MQFVAGDNATNMRPRRPTSVDRSQSQTRARPGVIFVSAYAPADTSELKSSDVLESVQRCLTASMPDIAPTSEARGEAVNALK